MDTHPPPLDALAVPEEMEADHVGFDIEEVGFDLGEYYEEGMGSLPLTSATTEERIRAMWAPMCSMEKVALPCPMRDGVRVPYLKAWSETDQREFFTIYAPGALDTRIEFLTAAIRSRRPGAQEVTHKEMDRPGWFKLCVSKFRLPLEEPWRDEYLQPEPNRITLGRLDSGPFAVWNWWEYPHKIIVGASGSGKTSEVRCILLQVSKHGGQAVVMTPKPTDVNLEPLSEIKDFTVIAGKDEAHFKAMAEKALWIREQFKRRIANLTGEYSDEPAIAWVIDEMGSVIMPRKGVDSEAIMGYKQTILSVFLEIAEQGRQAEIHIIGMVQTPSVKNMGGDQSLVNQMECRSAVRSLKSATFQALLFPLDGPEQKKCVKRLLSGNNTPKGRTIVSGVEAHDGDPWADVDRTPMQGFWISIEDTVANLRASGRSKINQDQPVGANGLPTFFTDADDDETDDTDDTVQGSETIEVEGVEIPYVEVESRSGPEQLPEEWTNRFSAEDSNGDPVNPKAAVAALDGMTAEEIDRELDSLERRLETMGDVSADESLRQAEDVGWVDRQAMLRKVLFVAATILHVFMLFTMMASNYGGWGAVLGLSIVPFIIYPMLGLHIYTVDKARQIKKPSLPKLTIAVLGVTFLIATMNATL